MDPWPLQAKGTVPERPYWKDFPARRSYLTGRPEICPIPSIGGGSIRIENESSEEDKELYPQNTFSEIVSLCNQEKISIIQLIYILEGYQLRDYLRTIWQAMRGAVERGLQTEGIYAYAVSEENAAENLVVTAPTCGSCGVLPSILYYMQEDRGFPEEEILDALAVAGLVGNVIRTNASISGAECGCQAEIGSACSMAAAAVAQLYGLSIDQIEYAAEIAMEHNLGLTCDPVGGLVQIPCIERNAVAAMRALSAVNLSRFLYATRKISFDDVVATMYRTGLDLNEKYRETAHGGLAVIYTEHKDKKKQK